LIDCHCVTLQTNEDSDSGSETDSDVSVLTLPHVLDLPFTSRDPASTNDDVTLRSRDVVKMACGSRHSVAVTSDGCVYSWGSNDYGQLGHGDLVSRDCPTVIECFIADNVRVVDVFAGYWNSVFATA